MSIGPSHVSSVLAVSHGPRALWYLTRGTGLVALVLLSAVIVLGIASWQGWSSKHWPKFFSQGLHRDLSLLCLVLVVAHVLTTVLDGFVPIGFLDAVLPFRSPYRSLYLGLGAMSFDLLLVLMVTSAIRHRIGYRTWKAIHWASYLCWPIALLHSLGTGTDTRLWPVLEVITASVLALSLTAMVLLAVGRLSSDRSRLATTASPGQRGDDRGDG